MLADGGLALTALLMGLAGGPHCVAMCGAACGGIARIDARSPARGAWLFQLGRLAGYSALGALAAASVQGMGWLGTQVVALRPVWTMFHAAAFVLGLAMLWQARQPLWLDHAGRRIWGFMRARAASGGDGRAGISGVGNTRRARRTPALVIPALGALWALLPCGLLYSALVVAALSGSMAAGAGVMALFALGSGTVLAAGPWAWSRLRGAGAGAGQAAWGVRLAGVALAAMSGWALWMGLWHDAAPWCATP